MKYFSLSFILFLFSSLFAQEDVNEVFGQKIYVKNLTINSLDSDFGPSLFGEYLIFSSARKSDSNSNKKWEANGQRFLNFYKGKIEDDGDVKDWFNLSASSNTPYHESGLVFNKQKNRVYFTRNNYYENKVNTLRVENGKIMKIALFIADVDADGSFYNIVPFPYNSNEYSTGLPALSNDGKTLYFISDMPGTQGKTDIFQCTINEDGTFSKPHNLGSNINTSGREMFPYIASDGTLFFSSDSRDGLGKFDIYKANSYNLDLTAVTNLGSPFNSARDDFAMVFNEDMHSGYFSSNRPDLGQGDDDIYFFYDEVFKKRMDDKANSLVQQKIEETIDDVQVVLNVLNEKSKKGIENVHVEVFEKVSGDKVFDSKVNDEGQVTFEAKTDTEYIVKAEKPLYEIEEIVIKIPANSTPSINEIIELKPETTLNSENKVVIDLNPIFFDYDSYDITKLAALELDRVISIMLKYPNMVIEATSHTDSRGPEVYNQKLSHKRARSTVDYIVNMGSIQIDRIVANGYGEERLTNKCSDGVKCTDAEHAANRRTEFVIINVDDFQ
jgi:outer membrane protein OmpA-like peptidoglycan-associated protein